MLEGLEISEIKLSELEYSMRFDAEYYQPKFLNYENIIKSKKGQPLSTLSKFLIGPFGSAFTVDNYTDDKSYRYIRGKDVKPMVLMDNDNVYMPKDDYIRLSKYALKENDILVSVVGTLGNAVIIEKENLPAIFSCKSTVLRADKVNPRYLLTYLNSKYGRDLLLRKERGAIQKGLNLDDLKVLDIFVPTPEFQYHISNIFDQSKINLTDSKSLYSQAEQLLLEELGLKNWQPLAENINEKSFKESFLSTGRLDAEYYQSKYEDYNNLVSNYQKGYKTIEWACQLKDINYVPKDNHQYKYIELANIGKTGEINGYSTDFGINLPTRARRQVKMGDVLISSIEGSLSSCALVTEEYDAAVCSTGFYVIKSKEINSETLLVLFKSEVLQNLLKQGCSGTILTAINKDEFLNIPIPIIEYAIQNNISSLIQESFMLRKQSEHLLEVAKRAVEIAIEQNEDAAMEYINENTYNYG